MRLRDFLLVICGGIAAGISGAVPELWMLAFVAPVPLLILIFRQGTSPKGATVAGFLFGFCMSGISIAWLWQALPLDWLTSNPLGAWWITFFSWFLASCALALGTAIFACLARLIAAGLLLDLFVIPVLWVIGEE